MLALAATITVQVDPKRDGWECLVTVAEQGSQTQHTVVVTRSYFEKLAGARERETGAGAQRSVEQLVEKSFEFLLQREPKESILRSFDLTIINRYFPEYEVEVRKAL